MERRRSAVSGARRRGSPFQWSDASITRRMAPRVQKFICLFCLFKNISYICEKNMDEELFFEKDKEVNISKGRFLEHWNQSDKFQFVTFRLGDSLPKGVRDYLCSIRENFIKNNPQPWDQNTANRFTNLISKGQERLIDNGYGSCILRHEQIRRILTETIWYHDGRSIEIDSYVLMPNHVHLLCRMIGQCKIEDVVGSIKRFSAQRINKILGTTGSLWHRDFYDTLVRSYDAYKHYRNYIYNNPRFLPKSDYELYMS